MRVMLIRHGLTEANLRHCYCGSTDLSLCGKGIDGLEELRRRAWPDVRDMRRVVSGLQRTRQTMEVLFGEGETAVEPELEEMDFGVFEGKTYEELKEDPAFLAWCAGDNEANVCPGGESGRQMEERVFRCMDRLLEAGEDLLVVTHGGPIAALMARYFPDEGKKRYEWQPAGGTGYLVVFTDGKPIRYEKIPRVGEREEKYEKEKA